MKKYQLALMTGVASLVFNASVFARTVDVHSGVELQNALQSAMPGDDIVLHPADYGDASFETSGNLAAYFFIDRDGTADDPITVRSHKKNDLQTLYGSGPNGFNNNYVLYVTGDHWIVRDLVIHTGKKGVMMDGANHNVFDNIEVHNIGDEAFHMRKSSSNNVLKNCYIHDSGKISGREGYGEGVYIGSHKGDELGDYAHNNTVAGCVLGSGVTAEPLEVKEATEGTIVESNWFLGGGVSGANFADSFIDVKGNTVTIRSNQFGDEGNTTISRGIHFLNKKTHLESWVYHNKANMEAGAPFLFVGEGVVHERWNTKVAHDDNNMAVTYSTGIVDNDIDPSVHKPGNGYPGYSNLPKHIIKPSVFHKKDKKPKKDKDAPDYTNCQSYTASDRTELDLSISPCVDLSVDLAGKTLQVWDSDTNPSCDFRGTVESLDGEGVLSVGGNYITSTEMTGQKILFTANNECQFVKMRIY